MLRDAILAFYHRHNTYHPCNGSQIGTGTNNGVKEITPQQYIIEHSRGAITPKTLARILSVDDKFVDVSIADSVLVVIDRADELYTVIPVLSAKVPKTTRLFYDGELADWPTPDSETSVILGECTQTKRESAALS